MKEEEWTDDVLPQGSKKRSKEKEKAEKEKEEKEKEEKEKGEEAFEEKGIEETKEEQRTDKNDDGILQRTKKRKRGTWPGKTIGDEEDEKDDNDEMNEKKISEKEDGDAREENPDWNDDEGLKPSKKRKRGKVLGKTVVVHEIMYKNVKKICHDLIRLCKRHPEICEEISSPLQKMLEEAQNIREKDVLDKLDDDEALTLLPFLKDHKNYVSISKGMKECDGRLKRNAPSLFPSEGIAHSDIEHVMKKNNVGDVSILGIDIKRLLPGCWVNDNIVNFWRLW
jgi:hypothetical protein